MTETIPEIFYEERRPITGNNRGFGFGAVLNRHPDDHDRHSGGEDFRGIFKVGKIAGSLNKADVGTNTWLVKTCNVTFAYLDFGNGKHQMKVSVTRMRSQSVPP